MAPSPRFPAMVRPVLLAALLVLGWLTPAWAQSASPAGLKPVMVVELFTSQGCSSCPPADVVLNTIAHRKDVIALTLPVDYWDYLGWKDTNASPRFTERQRAYAKSRGDGLIYTPQAVVNGLVHVNGASQHDVEQAIGKKIGRAHV